MNSRRSHMCLHINNKGIALISVLWITVILSIIIAIISYISRLELRQTNYFVSDIKLLNATYAGVEIAKDMIKKEINTYDSLNKNWAKTINKNIDDITLSISIIDEERKLNLNTSQKNILEKLFIFEDNEGLIDCLLDWIDADSFTHNNGAEEDYYKNLSPKIYCKNKNMDSLDELYLIKGFKDEKKLIQNLKNLTTINSNSKININTAPLEVLMTLPDITPFLAQKIVDARRGRDQIDGTFDDTPFTDISEINNIVNINIYAKIENKITISSSNFKVLIKASRGKYIKITEVMLKKAGNFINIKYWREF